MMNYYGINVATPGGPTTLVYDEEFYNERIRIMRAMPKVYWWDKATIDDIEYSVISYSNGFYVAMPGELGTKLQWTRNWDLPTINNK